MRDFPDVDNAIEMKVFAEALAPRIPCPRCGVRKGSCLPMDGLLDVWPALSMPHKERLEAAMLAEKRRREGAAK